jgi:Co/Zn/Cd efflux system component
MAPVVFSLAVLVFSLAAAFWMVADSVRRLIRPPFVEEEKLVMLSLLFLIVDFAQLFGSPVLTSRGAISWENDDISVAFALLGSVTAMISAVLIDLFEIYPADAVAVLAVAATLMDFTWVLLVPLVHRLLVNATPDNIGLIKKVTREIGAIRELRVWTIGEDANVATVKCTSGTDKIAPPSHLHGWDITLEIIPLA